MNKLSWLIKPIVSHSEDEGHRQASWLELFVDIGFVIAIGSITIAFDNGFSINSLLTYVGSFLIIFWIWNRFTWYATYYDNGDVPFRLCFIATIFCVLGIASSVEGLLIGSFFQFYSYYLIIELILLYLWSRVWQRSEYLKDRTQAKFFFVSYLLGTLLVVASIFSEGNLRLIIWASAVFTEAVGPVVAWQRLNSKVSVNTHHVVERHGLFTIILLGEGIIAISNNLGFPTSLSIILPSLMGYGIVALLWWTYFDYGFGFSTNLSNNMMRVFVFGYGQFFVFLSLSMIGVSLELGLHSLFGINATHKITTEIASAMLLWSTSAFILTMSAIQVTISTKNPKRIYLFRFACGIFLGVLAAFKNDLTFSTSIAIVLTTLLIIAINETYHWDIMKKS